MKRIALIMCSIALSVHGSAANETITLTVREGERQTFEGFGFSQSKWNGVRYNQLSQEKKNTLMQMLVKDLHLRVFRMWTADTVDFMVRIYHNTGLVDDLVANGVTMLLVAPACAPAPSIIAESIKYFENTTGLTVYASGVGNEVNAGKCLSADSTPARVRTLRSELNNRGLDHVKLIAPETVEWPPEKPEPPNYWGDDIRYLNALMVDQEAWSVLDGFATHSYGQGAKPEVADTVLKYGKEYWQTEFSNPENFKDTIPKEQEGNDRRAAVTAGAILGDLNHMVSHWVWFIGFNDEPSFPNDPEPGVKLILTHPTRTTDWIRIHLKYYYMKQIASTFEPGCAMRHTVADTALPTESMVWANYHEPHIAGTCGRNADGTWGISIVNMTGLHVSWEGGFIVRYDQAEALTYDVTVNVEELAGAATSDWKMLTSDAGAQLADKGTVTMDDGTVTVTIPSLQLVSLRSAESIEPTTIAQGPQSAVNADGELGVPRVRCLGSGRIAFDTPGAGTWDVRIVAPDGSLARRLLFQGGGAKTCTAGPAPGMYIVNMASRGRSYAQALVITE